MSDCVKCGHRNSDNADACVDCGWPFVVAAWKKWVFRSVSLLVGTLVGVLFCEAALRVRATILDQDPAEELQRTLRSSPPPIVEDCAQSKGTRLGQLVQPSLDHQVVYELKPKIDTCYLGVPVSTNSQGLRAPRDYAKPKPPGVYRVLLCGDSQTFGQGVAWEDTWGAILERELNARNPGRKVEVINTGVPGYNTAQEAAYLKRHGLSFEPDCVIVFFIGNDFGLPLLMLERRNVLSPGQSYLWRALKAVTRRPRYEDAWQIGEADLLDTVGEDQIERVPEAYRHMVGVAGYRRALESLAQAGKQAGIPVVDFADYMLFEAPLAAELVAFQRSLGIVHPDFVYPIKEKFRLSKLDAHFNADGHRKMAHRVLAGLAAEGVCQPR